MRHIQPPTGRPFIAALLFVASLASLIGGSAQLARASTGNQRHVVVTKHVIGGAPADTFSFTVMCDEFAVPAIEAGIGDGGGFGFYTIEGSTCTVSEIDPGPSWTTTVSIDNSSPFAGRGIQFVVGASDVQIDFTNMHAAPPGDPTVTLTVAKTVHGGQPGETFDFQLTCSSANGVVVVPFTLQDSGSIPFEVPADSNCVVVETSGGHWLPSHSIDGGPSTTGNMAQLSSVDEPVSIEFTNDRLYQVTVTKTVVGGQPGEQFVFELNCLEGGQYVNQATFALENGQSAPLAVVIGTQCKIEERDPGAEWETTMSFDGAQAVAGREQVVLGDGDHQLDFTNTHITPDIPDDAGDDPVDPPVDPPADQPSDPAGPPGTIGDVPSDVDEAITEVLTDTAEPAGSSEALPRTGTSVVRLLPWALSLIGSGIGLQLISALVRRRATV